MSTPTAHLPHSVSLTASRTRRPTASAPLNLCALCRQDFSSLRGFDFHMVGRPSARTRGCLTPDQLRGKGYRQDERGRWFSVADVESARRSFCRATEAQTDDAGLELASTALAGV